MEIKEEDLKPVFIFDGSEKDIENHIFDNIIDISLNCGWGEIEKAQQQLHASFVGGRIIVDISIIHKDNTATIIEVKNNKRNRIDVFSAIGQLLFYTNKLGLLWGAKPRMVIAMPEIDYEIYKTIKDYRLPICFLMVDGNRCIYLS